jgi:fructose-bisphosphate aldolase, class I
LDRKSLFVKLINSREAVVLMNQRVKEILGWYGSDNPGTLTNLARILCHGNLGGTGRLVILPVDQGFEHGPTKSFAPNPVGYDPTYHFQLAIEAECNAYAAPLGFIEAAVRDYPGEIPLILKANSHDQLYESEDPIPAITASVKDALRLGCSAIGFTIYPGSSERKRMYEEIRSLAEEAKACGLVVVIWSYPRGGGISKEGEIAVDVIAYAAHIAVQLGAHIVKVKPPSAYIEQEEAKKILARENVSIDTLAQRVRHVVQSVFNGRRIVIFSGGPAKDKESILEEIKAIKEGGGFGSIIGRNSFQRPKEGALQLLREIMDIYKN